jgi:hypothetical protein
LKKIFGNCTYHQNIQGIVGVLFEIGCVERLKQIESGDEQVMQGIAMVNLRQRNEGSDHVLMDIMYLVLQIGLQY